MKTDFNSETYKKFKQSLVDLGFSIHETDNNVTIYQDTHSFIFGLNNIDKKGEIIDITSYPITHILKMFVAQAYRRGMLDGKEQYKTNLQKAMVTANEP